MPKDKSKQKKKSAQQPAKEITEFKAVVEQDPSRLEESDSDDSGVDEKGIDRLMAALGEDGLDEIGQNMLKTLDESIVGDENSENSEVESSDEEEEEEEEEDSEDSEDEDEEDEEGGEYIPKVKLRAGLSSDDDDDDDEETDEEDQEENEIAKASKNSTSKQATKNTISASHVSDRNNEADIALDEVSDVDEDVIPQQKLTVNNKVSVELSTFKCSTSLLFKRALESILASIQLNKSLPWTETLTTIYPQTHDVDVSNDLERELSFYKQALHSAEAAKKLAAEHSLPFTRPSDFFAEMVKSDSHMERTRQRLLDETAQIKRSEEKRREREGKKFGKQVQVEKLKERERSKKELGEKIQSLKRSERHVRCFFF